MLLPRCFMRRTVRLSLYIPLLTVGATSMVSCSTRNVLKPNPQPKTSYEMVVPKGVRRYSLAPGETAMRPEPARQVAPVYPPSLLRPGAKPVAVVVQLTVDKQGRVYGVYPVSDTSKGPEAGLFEAAIRHAAMQWTFTPLWMETPNGDGTLDLTAKPFSLWYVFRFKVVNGKPIVITVKR